MRTLILFFIFASIIFNTAIAQNSGKGFSFQSLIRDKDGGILKAKNVQIYIRFYSEGTSTTLFEETHLTSTDDFGAIALSIGSGQKVSGSLSKFSDLNFGSSNIWYAISILDDGTKREIANQKFLSVPYAEFAYNTSPVPSGTILPFAGEVVPTGYLECNGTQHPKSQYPTLFNAIQNIWGTASNSTFFRLPDLRGLFLRGVDGLANRDPDKNTRTALISGQNSGNKVGSFQENEVKSHSHVLFTKDRGSANNGSFVGNDNTYAAGATTVNNAATEYGIVQSPSGQEPTMHKSKASGGNETRPKNVYVLYIIKI